MAGIYNNKIFKKIKEFNPDIIHTQTEYGVGLFGRLCGYKLEYSYSIYIPYQSL